MSLVRGNFVFSLNKEDHVDQVIRVLYYFTIVILRMKLSLPEEK